MALNAIATSDIFELGSEFVPVTTDITDMDGENVRYRMLREIASLLDPNASTSAKWEVWCWIHEFPQPRIRWDSSRENPMIEHPTERPFTFSVACMEQGCDPLEMVDLIHDLLEQAGVSIQRPNPIHVSARKAEMLRTKGISVSEELPEMQQSVGRRKRESPQMDLFLACGEMEDVDG